MALYFCKLISTEYTSDIEGHIKTFISTVSEDVTFQSFVPYWKDDSCGELSFSLSSDRTLTEIQRLFADHWRDDTADARWSTIHCPTTVFLWIST